MQTWKSSTLKYWMVSKNVNEANAVLCMNVPLYMTKQAAYFFFKMFAV
jgi:hypothetical protein